MSSILDDIKKYIGTCVSYDVFDLDIQMFINSAFVVLQQLGAGPTEPFSITGPKENWSDFSTDKTVINLSQQIIYSRVRLAFDPPSTSFVIKTYEDRIQELEWRLREYCDQIVPDNLFQDSKVPDCTCDPNEPEEPENPGEEIPPDVSGCDHDIATKPEIKSILDMVFT